MRSQQRYFSLWCPSWPVASSWLTLGSKPDAPTIVFDREDNKAHVLAVCPDGYRAGVRRGMRQRSAQAIVPNAHFCVTDPVSETKTFVRVLDIVRDMVPNVSLVRPGRLECDARGPSRYFGGESNAAHELRDRVRALGIDDVFIGVADTRFASYVAARIAPYNEDKSGVFIAPTGKESTTEFLAVQPLSLLDAPDMTSLLVRVGLSTLGDVAAMTAGDMLARFGPEGERIYALVTAHEDDRDEREVSVQHQALSEEYVSEDPLVSSEQAAFVAKNLAHRLSERLDNEALVCSELEIETYLSSGETCTRIWRVESSAFEQVVASRVLLQCDEWISQKGRENIEVSYADAHIYSESFPRGITKVIVHALHVVGSHRRQISLFGADPSRDEDALRVVERVKGLVGGTSVVELVPIGGRMPGESVVFREFSHTLDDLTSSGFRSNLFVDADESDLSCALHWPGAVIGKAPMCEYSPPVSARLLDSQNYPIRIHATGLANADPAFIECGALTPGRQEITNFAGPWPLEDRWWDSDKRRRVCRFQITCESGAYLIVTSGERASLVAAY